MAQCEGMDKDQLSMLYEWCWLHSAACHKEPSPVSDCLDSHRILHTSPLILSVLGLCRGLTSSSLHILWETRQRVHCGSSHAKMCTVNVSILPITERSYCWARSKPHTARSSLHSCNSALLKEGDHVLHQYALLSDTGSGTLKEISMENEIWLAMATTTMFVQGEQRWQEKTRKGLHVIQKPPWSCAWYSMWIIH